MVRLIVVDMGTRHSSPSGRPSHVFYLDGGGAPVSDSSPCRGGPRRLNLNTATEEELMTLEGVDRTAARNVVEHRRRIGRFRRIEDLALVVGAERVHALRPEVCVRTTSSRSASRDSLGSVESSRTGQQGGAVDVNKAGVFELQGVHGITQEIAAAIVHRREKRGRFGQLDDLLKVKGVDKVKLHNVAAYLTVDGGPEDPIRSNGDLRRAVLTNGYSVPRESVKLEGGPPPGGATALRNGLSAATESDIFELLSAYSPRPAAPGLASGSVRLASWNLHEFSRDKASNPGVREVVCRTILENGFSIMAVQDVTDATALRTICDELNKPTLARVKEWRDKQHYWNYRTSDTHDSKLGFVYDSDGAFDVELVSMRNGPPDLRRHCDSVIASFRIDELKVDLINVSMKNGADTTLVGRRLDELTDGDEPALIFVDVADGGPLLRPGGSLSPAAPGLRVLRNEAASRGRRASGGGVVTRGLHHMAIPNGWSWGGSVSPYRPVWTEL